MIKLKELTNRVYADKECIRFEYEVLGDDQSDSSFVARYERSDDDPLEWIMQIILPRDRDCDSQVYTFGYLLPQKKMPLAMVAAIGLKYFQMKLKEEIQQKSNWDFVLGSLLNDM